MRLEQLIKCTQRCTWLTWKKLPIQDYVEAENLCSWGSCGQKIWLGVSLCGKVILQALARLKHKEALSHKQLTTKKCYKILEKIMWLLQTFRNSTKWSAASATLIFFGRLRPAGWGVSRCIKTRREAMSLSHSADKNQHILPKNIFLYIFTLYTT